MKAIGALPTEERVQKMNNYQWLWYYHNLQEEQKKTIDERNNLVDYITFFINPDLAKAVQEKKNLDKGKDVRKRNELNSNETYNDDFEKEFGKYFQNKEGFIELPNSNGMTLNETEEEFFKKAMKIQEYVQQNPQDTFFKELPKAQRINKKMSEEEIIKYSVENNMDMIFTPDSI